jgi:Cu+-exporting ATPase
MSEVCYHCGSESNTWVTHDDKQFCCEGCATVYDILKSNNLHGYYDYEQTPGVKPSIENKEVYDYLDQEDIKRSVLDFYDGQLARITLYIPVIHCSSCVWLLEHLDQLNPGIIKSRVNFNKKESSITYDETKIKLSELMSLLTAIHYKPHLQKQRKESRSKAGKQLIIKLGVAGFAFGNVMLLSFPEYLSQDVALNSNLIHAFGYLALLLSLPVLFYAASDYFATAWKNLKHRIISIDLPIAIGIVAIFLRSAYEIFTGTGPGYLDSLTGLVFFLLIGKWFQNRTYQALSFDTDYASYFPLGIIKVANGEEEIVPVKYLAAGDHIRVKNGEILPADAELVSDDCAIDYSFITGESMPVEKEKGDEIYAGGKLIGKSVDLIVKKNVETSYLAQLWKERTGDDKPSVISNTLNQVSKYFTIVVLLIGGSTFLYWSFIDISIAFFAFTSVLIVACPCALALSVPFAFGHAQRFFGRNQFYLRESSVIENLAKVDTLVFDKTGTLTDPNTFDIAFVGDKAVPFEFIKSAVQQSHHPLSKAIFDHLQEYELKEVETFNESAGLGLYAKIAGKSVQLGSASFIKGARKQDDETAVHVAIDDEYKGYFRIRNHYRKNWKEMILKVIHLFDVHLLSGDNETERKTFQELIKQPEHLNFKQTPKDKLNYLELLNQAGKHTMMVGDGLNDAAALKESLVGVTVADDVYQFSPNSDAIIDAKAITRLPAFFSFVRATMRVVWASFVLSFMYNVVGIYFAASGSLKPVVAAILMPLSSITIVAFTSLATLWMARRNGMK